MIKYRDFKRSYARGVLFYVMKRSECSITGERLTMNR